ncbi:SDR family oxidoreductase [Sinomonas terrae]|uniref:SDR family oxidoreductase n=1 Tax=Sinomonas terrae TaxID=2908838 RepID=A0ABS9U472_9MICC|nr:SDR family oxidoreductase [Sinomonas terrae]MCH6471317.1 SDR family oxidoreductase [Sinomonas terrae]
MDLGITGKTAFVAASTSGLGLAVARALAADGVRVAITGRRREISEQIAESLPGAVAIGVDLGAPDAVASAVDQAEERLGPIDIAVLNGPGPRPSTAAALTSEDLANSFDRLVRPQHDLVSRVLPEMRQRRWGRILAVGASGIVAPLPNLASSNAGRAALAGYLKTLAAEVARDAVTVNLLLPGRIATDRVAELDAETAKRRGISVDEVQQESRESIPAGRYGTPEEFGAAAAFLCSASASYITGVALRCDGGLVRSL